MSCAAPPRRASPRLASWCRFCFSFRFWRSAGRRAACGVAPWSRGVGVRRGGVRRCAMVIHGDGASARGSSHRTARRTSERAEAREQRASRAPAPHIHKRRVGAPILFEDAEDTAYSRTPPIQGQRRLSQLASAINTTHPSPPTAVDQVSAIGDSAADANAYVGCRRPEQRARACALLRKGVTRTSRL